MDKIKLTDIDIYKIGNEIQLSGAIWSGPNKSFLCTFPLEDLENPIHLPMDIDEWKKFLRQSDLQETEILKQGPQGITKAIIRKSQRQVDSRVIWKVYEKDGYKCRYCGRSGIPLTIEHIRLWEMGGITAEINLLTSCRNCNKTRGSIPYEKWIKSKRYEKLSVNLPDDIKEKNLSKIGDLKHIKTLDVKHIRSR